MNRSECAVVREILANYKTGVITSEQLVGGITDVVERANTILEPILVNKQGLYLNMWIRDLKTLSREDLVSVRDELDNQLDYASHELSKRVK